MNEQNLKLGVNIDHVATLRQARGTTYPDPVDAFALCEEAGAGGITVHLREDRRHIQDRDVRELRKRITTRLNLEMANTPEIVAFALDIQPHEVCLVPEKREELTTEGGLDIAAHTAELKPTVTALSEAGIAVSPFIDPEPAQLDAARQLGAPCVELHTGAFCDATGARAEAELDRLVQAARYGHKIGLQINAGHGINLATIEAVLDIPHLNTLNIGHSIIARSVFVGLKEAVAEMLRAMAAYQGGRE